MAHVARWDFAFSGGVAAYEGHAEGFARAAIVDRGVGATHTELALCRLGPGGRIETHVHAFERCVYVLEGEAVLELDGRALHLERGHFALFPVGMPHGWRNEAEAEVRWLELSTPQPDVAGERPDTFFVPGGPEPSAEAVRPDPSDPRSRYVGRYLGTPPQLEALHVDAHDVRGRSPAGMDTALLAYSGISIKMLVDTGLGADLLTMFMVDYEPGGAAQVHDHPFEEAYFFLEGEIEADVDGVHRTLRAGDVLFCGVGELHGFFNTSGGRVRWIETQAPQPPRRHSYLWPAYWEALRERLASDGA